MHSLELLRRLPATAERVFDAWTDEKALIEWWGPEGVRCVSASIDLQVGGAYRILNELPDGTRLTISGEFRTIERPKLLVFTWLVDAAGSSEELVTVSLEAIGDETEIRIRHDRIPNEQTKQRHHTGWQGCIAGLENYVKN